MGAVADVRAHVAAALGGVGVPVHTHPPGAVQPPCIILTPGDPWWEPRALVSAAVGYDVRILATSAGGGTPSLDQLVDDTLSALVVAGVGVEPVGSPNVETDPGLLVVVIPTVTVWED